MLVSLLALWVGVTFLYWRGASGVGFAGGGSGGGGGAGISFDRPSDFALFKIDDRVALLVTRDGPEAVVKVARGAFPFCPLCGTYDLRGSVVNGARFYQNGWIYTDSPGGPFAELYQVATGKTVDVARPPPGVDVRTLPDYTTRGLTFEPSYQLTPTLIHELFRPLSAINESCVVFNAAFLLLACAWLVVALAIVIRGRRIG